MRSNERKITYRVQVMQLNAIILYHNPLCFATA
nr:MAG TPA: hypothetical protein [Caudoviricetes sp.]